MTSTLETREADGQTSRRWFRVLKSVLAWGLLALLAFLIWPSSLGGGTTTIIVNGESMEPTYYTGDIVIAREGTPQVGDIVVYTMPELGGGQIVHRIIGGDGETGWDIQGDNNDFVDPFHPTNEEVLGIAKIQLPAIGKAASILSSPLVWGSMLLVAFGLIIWPSKECDDDDDDDDDDPNRDDCAPNESDGITYPAAGADLTDSPASSTLRAQD